MILVVVVLPILYYIYPPAAEMVSLDDAVFYTPEETFMIVESWGDTGRALQMWFHLTWDVCIPVLSIFLFGLSISWLFQRGFKPESRLQRLNLIALTGIFDLSENFCIVTLIIAYPAEPVAVAWLKTIFTAMKYASLIPIILILLIGLVAAARNRFKIQGAARPPRSV